MEVVKKRRTLKIWTCGDSERKLANTGRVNLRWKDHKEGSKLIEWLDDVKKWTGLSSNETWSEPDGLEKAGQS